MSLIQILSNHLLPLLLLSPTNRDVEIIFPFSLLVLVGDNNKKIVNANPF
jgi:hypothetical protein